MQYWICIHAKISEKNCNSTFIGEAASLSNRIISHNSGFGVNAQVVQGMQPVALWAYICGFDNDSKFRQYIYNEWDRKRNELCGEGITCPMQIAKCTATRSPKIKWLANSMHILSD